MNTYYGGGARASRVWKWSSDDEVTRPALAQDMQSDVVIVGAGYTGLWTAYYLLKSDPAIRVAILEQEVVGYGGSGRNAGFCTAGGALSVERIAREYSPEAAIHYQEAMNGTVEEVHRVTKEEGIHCDFDKSGLLLLARNRGQEKRGRLGVENSAALGLQEQWFWLGPAEAKKKVNATRVRGAMFSPHGATVDPGKLVLGLARTVESMGGKIYERTPALSLREREVVTPGGTASGEVIVNATESYTSTLPGWRRQVAPLYSLVLATEPLSKTQLETTGLNPEHKVGFNDMRNIRIYARLTADKRLVFGGRGAPYAMRSKISDALDLNTRLHNRLHETVLEFFPSLKGVNICHKWGGPLGVPRDWHPSINYDPTSGIAWAGGYVGGGVGPSNLSGRILASLIRGETNELTRLPMVGHRSPRWEFEPIRWLGVNAGLLAANIADIEERLFHEPSRVGRALERLTGVQ